MVVVLFVEGGATNNQALNVECRRAFKRFLKQAGCKRFIQVVPCGPRLEAMRQFRAAVEIEPDKHPLLLVDSERAFAEEATWAHLQVEGAEWTKPTAAEDHHGHLMVQLMETWLVADVERLAEFYPEGFRRGQLPIEDLEAIPKAEIFAAIDRATQDKYRKRDAYQLLEGTDPKAVEAACPTAKRFFDHLRSL